MKSNRRSNNISFVSFSLALLFGMSILAGCGSGGSGGSTPEGNGGGTPSLQAPVLPTVLSLSPEHGAKDVPVDAVVEMTFSKSMDPASFMTGLAGFQHSEDRFSCVVDSDCKIIRFTPGDLFLYDKDYTLELTTGISGVKDSEGKTLAAPVKWSFTIVSENAFVPALGFKSVMLDGGGLPDKNGIPIDDAGECTSIEVDSKGAVHIAYLSVSDARPKHASCSSGKDCSKRKDWEIEIIDKEASNPGLGRDINMDIDSEDNIHVTYRDYCVGGCNNPGSPTDNFGILKYAVKKAGDVWRSTVVEDTIDGVTDMYIKAGTDGRIHISYRAKMNPQAVLNYATCSSADCLTGPWFTTTVDSGPEDGNSEFAGPSSLFLTGNAVHISYHANGTLKYAACALALETDCRHPEDWGKVLVDAGASGQVGTDSSLFVNSDGIYITYRDNAKADLKYAYCLPASNCLLSESWKASALDTRGDMGVCTRLVIGANGFHVIYADRTNRDVMYGHCRENCLNPGSWRFYRIDAPGEVGWDAYLALGPDGKVHVSYRDHLKRALKYAWGEPPPI